MADKFDPEGSGYDYETARGVGIRPEPVPHDTVPHWPSREPVTGLELKGRRHPTFGLGVEEDRKMGYDVYPGPGGRYYSIERGTPLPNYRRGGTVGAINTYRAGGFVRRPENETRDYALRREPYRPNRDVPKGMDPLLDRGPYEPWRDERAQDQEAPPEEELRDFEHGSPRHPRFPYMYGPRDDEYYDTPGPGNYRRGGVIPHMATGGASSQQGMQSFGYDPSAYVTEATKWAEDWLGKGQNEYEWAKDQFNKNSATGDLVTKAALANAGLFDNATKAGLSRYENLYTPAMAEQLAFARNYASPENLALYRSQAQAGVGQAYDAEALAQSKRLEGYGLDPTAVASRLDTGVRLSRAAAEAGAGTQSDINNKLIGQQLLGQAINTGQQDQAITQAGANIAASNRNQAINTGLATTASGSATRGGPQGWAGLGGQELAQWPKSELDAMHASNEQGALWNDINRTNLAAQQQKYNQGSGWGALIGGVLGAGLGAFGGPMGMSLGSSLGKSLGGAVGNAAGGGGGGGSGWTFAQGGVTPGVTTGSVVPPNASVPGIRGPDKVPAMLQSGEGIVPKEIMDHIGHEGFRKFLEKAYAAIGKFNQPIGGEEKPVPRQAMQTGPTFASQGALQ